MAQRVDGDCSFCAIAEGIDETAEIVCAGKTWLAFFPLSPATPGHTLIIPRLHVADLWQLEPALARDLMEATIAVGNAIQEALNLEGMNLITSAGTAAEQTIFHVHLHLVPRWKRDGFGRIWPTDTSYSDDALGNVTAAIREACSNPRY